MHLGLVWKCLGFAQMFVRFGPEYHEHVPHQHTIAREFIPMNDLV